MAYTPTEWVSGTIISASKLNNIERGVESVNSEYAPTTWAEGDTVTAAKLNKIEQGIAALSNDFSTAEVTITNTEEDTVISFGGTYIYNDEELSSNDKVNYGTKTITVVLFKGSQIIYLDAETITSTEGSVTGSLWDGFTVTGDCTIVGEGFGIE